MVGHESKDILIERCQFFDNGIEGSLYEHNAYTEALGMIFQFNRFAPLRRGCRGNNLKDRSAGLIVRYNWIEGGNRQLDLVDAEDGAKIRRSPLYRATHVYRNVLIEHANDGNNQIVHYGGDSGQTPNYRKGTLHFFHNTVISNRRDQTTLFRLSTNDEQADCRNNILYVKAAGRNLSMLDDTGVVKLQSNWLKPDWKASHDTLTGSIVLGFQRLPTGTSPGFINQTTQDYRLAPASTCIDAAAELHPDALSTIPHLRQHASWQRESKPLASAQTDVGAFEFIPAVNRP